MLKPGIIGIDPGLSGAIAVVSSAGELVVADMPTFSIERGGKVKRDLNRIALSAMIAQARLHGTKAYVEQVGAMPGQGVSSMFAFGKAYGVILGVLAAHAFSVTDVPPQTWKKKMRVNGGKDGARARASELMPEYAEFWKLAKHDGRAEAALIAYFGSVYETN